jgi:invasion protein IalB
MIQALIILLFGFASMTAAQAQQSSDCKKRREQQQAWTKNYAAKTCKTEYDICMNGCKK